MLNLINMSFFKHTFPESFLKSGFHMRTSKSRGVYPVQEDESNTLLHQSVIFCQTLSPGNPKSIQLQTGIKITIFIERYICIANQLSQLEHRTCTNMYSHEGFYFCREHNFDRDERRKVARKIVRKHIKSK